MFEPASLVETHTPFTSPLNIMAPKKKVERPQENVSLGPQVRDGELVFGVARIFASKFSIFSPQERHQEPVAFQYVSFRRMFLFFIESGLTIRL
jgi:hypothetical protein